MVDCLALSFFHCSKNLVHLSAKQCDQILEQNEPQIFPKDAQKVVPTAVFTQMEMSFKIVLKESKYFVVSCKKICHQERSINIQFGHTDPKHPI